MPDNQLDVLLKSMKSAASPCRAVLRDLHEKYKNENHGAVANYIPELAVANPDWFGITIATVDGQIFEVGDSQQSFTIQSISKPFVYALALEDHGREHVLTKVGVEPTGDAFNAIILDQESNRPFNPMVNAGAIATADLIKGADLTERLKRLLASIGRYTSRDMNVNNAVFLSERSTGHRNRAIAHLMLNFGMIGKALDETLELYFQQCSIEVNCRDLAMMGATLANGGANPVTGIRAVSEEYIRDILSVMYTCGMYDFSGEWAYRVGLPAKSGVGGGIVAVVPGEMGIGIFSPRLDAKGNSTRGLKVCMDLAEKFHLHGFSSAVSRKPFMEQVKQLGSRPTRQVSAETLA